MQIVIEIDDNLYTRLFDNGVEYASDMRRACVAIRNGTPLPKGHGDLIDRDKLLKEPPIDLAYHPSNYVKAAKAIIEADKEGA